MEDEIYYDKKEQSKKSIRIGLDKKTVIIITIIVTIIIVSGTLLLKESDKTITEKYTIEIDNPIIMYMNEPLDIPITVKGPKKNINEVMTFATSKTEEIVTVDDNDFAGSKGSVLIEPITIGEDDINIVSTTGADKYAQTVGKKKVRVIVCESFDDNLVTSKQMTLSIHSVSKPVLTFTNKNCYKYISYKIEDERIAEVHEDGTVVGLAVGKTTLTVDNVTNKIVININVTE